MKRGGGGRARKPISSTTSDLLTWPHQTQLDSSTVSTTSALPNIGHRQPATSMSPVLFGAPIGAGEAEDVPKRKPCSGTKFKEMRGSGIFAVDNENRASESGRPFSTRRKTSGKICENTSQISFGADERISPMKPISIAGAAKQRELSRTVVSDPESKMNKQVSDAKCKELSGTDIFAPPPEVQPKPLGPRNLALVGSIHLGDVLNHVPDNTDGKDPSMKTTKKALDQKVADLTGNDIFKDDTPLGPSEKSVSVAKLREIHGNDIFADVKSDNRVRRGGIHKSSRGDSSIAFV